MYPSIHLSICGPHFLDLFCPTLTENRAQPLAFGEPVRELRSLAALGKNFVGLEEKVGRLGAPEVWIPPTKAD